MSLSNRDLFKTLLSLSTLYLMMPIVVGLSNDHAATTLFLPPSLAL